MVLLIEEVRLARGLSRNELAKRCEIPVNSLERLERLNQIVLERIENVAAVLGVSPAYLCGWSTEKREPVVVKEKIVEVPVVEKVYHKTVMIPECWKVEDNKIIKWRER